MIGENTQGTSEQNILLYCFESFLSQGLLVTRWRRKKEKGKEVIKEVKELKHNKETNQQIVTKWKVILHQQWKMEEVWSKKSAHRQIDEFPRS